MPQPAAPGHPGVLCDAGCICRAWVRFLRSPGRLRQAAAASRIQAAWRGAACRRVTSGLLEEARERQTLLAALRAAVGAGQQQLAREAAARLQSLGCSEAAQLLAEVERRATEAAGALREAASQGSAAGYAAAAATAARFSDLGPVLQEAAGLFEARMAAARQAVDAEVEGGQPWRWQQGAGHCSALHHA